MRRKIFCVLLAICLIILAVPVINPSVRAEAKKKTTAKQTTVKLNHTEYELKEGSKFKLKLKGATAASFASSDKSVAKVTKKGNVSGKKIGEAVITVTDTKGKEYTCKVTVIYDAEHHKHTKAKLQGYAATCAEPGLTNGEYCVTCGAEITPQTVIPAKGHNYNKKGKCTICGEMDPDYKPPHEHTYVVETKEPTCTEPGHTQKVYCSSCGEVFLQPEELKPLGHKYFEGYCTVCGAKEIHEYVVVPGKAPTCVEPGYTDYIYCKICGEIKQNADMLDPTGHDYQGGDHCVKCGADIYGHVHTWVIQPAVAATCTEPGLSEGKYCSTCGHVEYIQEFQSRIPHNYVDGKCTMCGKKENE